ADYRVSARVVVNAAGPWVDEVRALAGARGGPRLHLTKGIHLVVPHARLPVRHAVVMQARDRRAVFAVPRDGATYIGTTDTDHGPPVDHPEVTAEDAEYLLDAANRGFTGPPLAPTDVTGTWAGLRPLLHEEGKRPSEISRKDEIMVDEATGLVSIAGGKLTTYRRMAERVVDLVCERLGHRAPCRTDGVPLPGGERLPEEVARQLPALPAGAAERLVRLYGAEAETIAARGGETLAAHRTDYWILAHLRARQGRLAGGPACVVRPHSTAEVAAAVRTAQRLGVAVVPYGAGSGVVGGATPPDRSLVIDLSAMNALLEVHDTALYACAQAGMLGGAYEAAVGARGYTSGHYPQSIDRSTVGGWVATRAAGQFSTRYGNIEDLCL